MEYGLNSGDRTEVGKKRLFPIQIFRELLPNGFEIHPQSVLNRSFVVFAQDFGMADHLPEYAPDILDFVVRNDLRCNFPWKTLG